VPNECVGLIIGKGGETIRQLQQQTGAKIQVAKKEMPHKGVRNVFVEGSVERYDHAKRLIDEIIAEVRHSLSLLVVPQDPRHLIRHPLRRLFDSELHRGRAHR
jgi:far upstream element-binding protein